MSRKHRSKVLEIRSVLDIPKYYSGIVKFPSGTTHWYHRGLLHRINGPAIVQRDGTKVWYFANQRHRLNGPAVECCDGTKEWYFKGLKHREDGPAEILIEGAEYYWFFGTRYSMKEHRELCIELNYLDNVVRKFYNNYKNYPGLKSVDLCWDVDNYDYFINVIVSEKDIKYVPDYFFMIKVKITVVH